VRPLELALEGFRSYRAATTIDFQDRSLFGIVGPTGAGKSSILDGLIYALYGRTPQIGRETKKLITSGEPAARVQFRFAVDGVTWEVTRVLREQGASAVTLRRLGDDVPETSGERAVNDRIVEVVGLDFDSFCSSVTLPQGEFDRFLKATPTDRSKILKRIFRYERVDAIKDLAKQRAAAVDGEAKAVEAELATLPADPEQLLRDLEAERAVAQARVAELGEAAARFAAAEGVVAAAEQKLAAIRAEAARIDAAVRALPAAASLEALAGDEEAAVGRLQAALAGQEERAAASCMAEEEAARREAELGGAVLAEARSLVAQRARAAQAAATRAETIPGLQAAAEAAAAALDRHHRALAAAEEQAGAAEQALRAAEQGHAAHLLRAELRPGEACPVCEQTVDVLPGAGSVPAALEAARAAAAAARGAAGALRAKLPAVLAGSSAAAASLAASEEELVRSRSELAGVEAALAGLLGAGVDAAAEVARRDAMIAAAAGELAEARKRAAAAAEAVAAARRALDEKAGRRRRVAGELIRIATVVGAEPPGIDDDAAFLAGAAKRARDAGAALLAEAAARREAVVADEAEARELLGGLRQRLGLGPGEGLDDAFRRASEAVGALGERVARAGAAIEKRRELETRAAELQERRGVYQRIAADFTDSKFTAYLLDADRQRLAAVGSEKLFQLTGRYRFDEEGQFHLLDLLNDKVRSPDTLSGGETFLASLALALALAEAVSEGGSRLDCFFLDEGFGSLDAESLDLAMNGVTSLALPGRLIGVISHVAGVQAFLDDLIVLDKAADGSTVVVQTEGPLGYAAGAI
jgi:exonuclease SbcC